MKIAFLVGDIVNISGGSNVIIEYAAGLQRLGHEVALVTEQPVALGDTPWHPALRTLPVLPLAEAATQRYDAGFATWWPTFFNLWRLDCRIYGYLNQSVEMRFHQEPFLKQLNRLTYSLPVLFVTEARWIAEFIGQVQPEGRVIYVQNGLSGDFFPRAAVLPARSPTLRVLVEGPWGVGFKGVPETFEVLAQARKRCSFETGWLTSSSGEQRPVLAGEPVRVHERIPINRVHEVLRRYDVLIKLSKVEGMFGPPLEMFSQGGTAITYPVTGSDEYMVHGHNSLLVEPSNRWQISRYLELLAAQPEYLAHLKANALKTAQAYPDWAQATQRLSDALQEAVREGYSNAALRGALASVSTAAGHWWSLAAGADAQLGSGERKLLEGYRRLKRLGPVSRLKAALPSSVKRRLRAYATRVLS